jgi:GAF domain-containing protein
MNDGHQPLPSPDRQDEPRRIHSLALVEGGGARRPTGPDVPGSALDTARISAGILSVRGPVAALRFVNARTRFRFTGIYRAEPPFLRNVHLYDREKHGVNVSGEVSGLDETYCGLVWEADRPFSTRDSLTDARVASHAARVRVQSYCGVPIRRQGGQVWGTLCHFDVRPRLVPRAEVGLLELIARGFAAALTDGSPTP